MGNSDDLSSWQLGPAPASITVRKQAGAGGSDRVTLIWANGVIQKQWLQVTVKADAVTGLAEPDVFYFGNAVGESGNSPSNTFVDGSDFASARDNQRNFLNRAPIDFAYDYNRDSFVDGTDMAIARDNNTNFITALKLVTVPDTTPLTITNMFAATAPVTTSTSNTQKFGALILEQPQSAFLSPLDEESTALGGVNILT